MSKDINKIRSLRNLTEEKLRKEIFDQIWPYEKLKLDITKLEKLSHPPIVKVASFLFKAQLVEHELKRFIEFLDEILEKETSVLPFKKIRSRRSSKALKKMWGLGQLRNELENYRNEDIKEIIKNIDRFKKNRDRFTHQLYNETDDMSNLARRSEGNQRDAAECLKLITVAKNKIILEIYQLRINKIIKKHDI